MGLGDDEGELLLLKNIEERLAADCVGRSRVSRLLVRKVSYVGIGQCESSTATSASFLRVASTQDILAFPFRSLEISSSVAARKLTSIS